MTGLAAVFVLSAACSSDTATTTTTTKAGGAGATAGPTFAATLVGSTEIPGPGDSNGSGSARVTLNAITGEVCFDMTVNGIAQASAAHIHEGGPGVAGPVVVPLTAPTSGTTKACVPVEKEVVGRILSNPPGHYVNVHTDDFPGGAVRGQLSLS